MKLKLQNVVLKNTDQQMVKYNSIAEKVSFYDFFKHILSTRQPPQCLISGSLDYVCHSNNKKTTIKTQKHDERKSDSIILKKQDFLLKYRINKSLKDHLWQTLPVYF